MTIFYIARISGKSSDAEAISLRTEYLRKAPRLT